MADLTIRRRADLEVKLGSLDRELGGWQARSAAGKPLEKHHTQIDRLATTLRSLCAVAKAELDAAITNGKVLDVARDLERAVLEAHRTWDFFRSKLVLRDVELFRPALRAADALAWACYTPARNAARAPAPKEPPLVFFNGGSSPFVLPRGERFFAETTLFDEEIESPDVDAVLRDLPIPVIGIPWFHSDHAPDMLVLGHEVGHTAEADLALTTTLQTLLDGAGILNDRREAWKSWLGEVFADVYGALSLGPAFAGCLADFLADSPAMIASERRAKPDWDVYPSATLRVLLVSAVLEGTPATAPQKTFAAEAAALRNGWSQLYPAHAMAPYEPDIPKIAAALADGAYPELDGRSLRDVVAFTRAGHDAARKTSRLLLTNYALDETDPRVLFAGARLAFEADPATFAACGATAAVFAHIVETEEKGTRAAVAPAPGSPAAEAEAATALAKATADAARGAELFRALRSAIAGLSR